MASSSDESIAEEKVGMHLRRGSDVEKKYQEGARASVHDVKDHGLDIMDKMGGITMSMGAVARGRGDRSVMGFITDESSCAGFALVGALETGIATPGGGGHDAKPKTRKERKTTSGGDRPAVTVNNAPRGIMERRNYFIANRGTITQIFCAPFNFSFVNVSLVIISSYLFRFD